LQHSESHRGIRLHVLDMEYEGGALELADKPTRRAQQQRRRDHDKNIRARKHQDSQRRGPDEAGFVKYPLEGRDSRRNKVPASPFSFVPTESARRSWRPREIRKPREAARNNNLRARRESPFARCKCKGSAGGDGMAGVATTV